MGHPKQKPVMFPGLHTAGSKRSYGTPGTIIAPAVTKKTTNPTRVVQPSWNGFCGLVPRRPCSPSSRKVRIVYGNRPYPRALPRSFFQRRDEQYEPMDWDDCTISEVVLLDQDQIMEELFENGPLKDARSHANDTDPITTSHAASGTPRFWPVEEKACSADVEFMDLSAWEQSIFAIPAPPFSTSPRRVSFVDTVPEKVPHKAEPTIRPTEQTNRLLRSRRGLSGGLQPLAGMRRLDLGLTNLPPPPPDSDDERPTAGVFTPVPVANNDDGALLAGKRGRQLAQLETNGTRRKLAVSVVSDKVEGVQPRPARSLTPGGGFTLGNRTSANL